MTEKKNLTKLYEKSEETENWTSEDRRYLASTDIEFFATYYLSKHIKSEVPELHKLWYSILERFPKSAIAAPRETAKTTIYSLVYPLWRILNKKSKFIVIISDSQEQSQYMVGAIAEELETNELIHEDYGNIAGYLPINAKDKKKWSAKEIVTTTNIKVSAKSFKSRLRGIKHSENRPDLILIDDCENQNNIRSQEQRELMQQIFDKAIMNLGKYAEIKMVGTILHFDSLLNNLIKDPKPGWFTKLYRSIGEENIKLSGSEVLAPELWTLEELEAKRAEIGSINFECEMQNNPLDKGSQIFYINSTYDYELDNSFIDKYSSIDLASRLKEQNDHTAIVTAGRHKVTGDIYIIDPQRIRGTLQELYDWLARYYKKHLPIKIAVESNGFATWFNDFCLSESKKEGLYLPLLPFDKLTDKVTEAKSVSVYFENGTVKVPEGPEYREYREELEQFPQGAFNDFCDASIQAVKLALQSGGSGVIRSSGNWYSKPKQTIERGVILDTPEGGKRQIMRSQRWTESLFNKWK